MSLTKAQKRTLKTICEYIEEHGYPPTLREIAEADKVSSPSTVKAHIDMLEGKGYIAFGYIKGNRVARSLRVRKEAE